MASSFHAKLLHEDAMFNRSHPVRSSSPTPLENFDTEDDEKAIHIANLQKEYNRRLIKPLQINSRLKMQTEAAIGSLSGQFMVPRHPILVFEDTERKYLVNQVKEIDKISAYHDKEAGIIKPKKKKSKQRSILEQHLEGDLYNYIKAVKDKAAELKRAQIAAGKKMHMTADAESEEEHQLHHHKDTKELVHKQLDAIRAEKDKHVKLKQLNTNSYVRYSERKMLVLRTIEDMESVPQQDKTGMAFFRNEAKKEKLKRRPITLITKKSMSFKSNDQSTQSALHVKAKPSHDFGKPLESPIAASSEHPKNVSFYKAYDLGGFNRGSRNLDFDSNEFTTIPSPEITTPTELQRGVSDPKAKFFGFNLPINKEVENHNRIKSQSFVGRANSQPFGIDVQDTEIIEVRDGESQTQRGPADLIDSPTVSQTIENKDPYETPKEQNHTGRKHAQYRPATEFPPGFGSEKLIRHNQLDNTNCEAINKVYQEDLAGKRLRENYRKNLLGNIQKAKTHKGSLLTESDSHTATLAVKKWTDINQPAILAKEPIKYKGSSRRLKRAKKQGKNVTSDQVMTEMDHESYLSQEKVPLREEMQGLLTKYGYKSAMIETSFASSRVIKKPQQGRMLQDSLNKEKLKKIDRFLRQTSFKTTKAIKVD